MNLYYRCVFPRWLDFVMSSATLTEQRRIVIPQAAGEVLELGFGTGRNLPFYSENTKSLTAIEPNEALQRKAMRRVAESPFHINVLSVNAEAMLPIQNNSIDTVVSTWTLCSIANIQKALDEVYRVLKPGGKFIFVEHGLSPDLSVARWQNRLNGIERAIAGGCNLNRDIDGLIRVSPLALQHCENFYLPKTPRVWGYSYRGVALKK